MKFKIFRFNKVKSTNNTAIRIIKNYNYDFGMILSDLQVNGRGQYGKKWVSYKGNLFVSFFYNLKKFKISLNKLTKINCLLVKKCISKNYKKKFNFKNKFDNTYLVVGIGVNLIKSPLIRNYPTTHLRELINKDISKKKFELKLKKIFENNLKRLIKKRV